MHWATGNGNARVLSPLLTISFCKWYKMRRFNARARYTTVPREEKKKKTTTKKKKTQAATLQLLMFASVSTLGFDHHHMLADGLKDPLHNAELEPAGNAHTIRCRPRGGSLGKDSTAQHNVTRSMPQQIEVRRGHRIGCAQRVKSALGNAEQQRLGPLAKRWVIHSRRRIVVVCLLVLWRGWMGWLQSRCSTPKETPSGR